MKRVIFVISLVLLLVVATFLYINFTRVPKEPLARGMLSVSSGSNCGIPEGCGPSRIYDENMKPGIALIGKLNSQDSEKIVEVYGSMTEIRDIQPGLYPSGGSIPAIAVTGYRVLSKIRYHDFLVKESDKYMKSRFGCSCPDPYSCGFSHNKTFGWEYIQQPIIKVRWTQDNKYAELWYDGNSGVFIKEIIVPSTVSFCANKK